MEAILTNIVAAVNDVLWNKYLVLLFLLLGSGIYFTIRTGFVQVRKFGEGMRLVFGNISLKGKEAGKDGMSSFQALATAIAAQVGTGNIAGCASALVSGGPGAVFWMWVSAFFGVATIYGEAVLAQKYKEVSEDGAVSGGPIYYIKAAFKGKLGTFMAGFFAVAIILALGFMGNMVQSNSIGDAFYTAFGVPKIAAGIVVAAVSAFIFLGGVKRIAAITEKLVPIMAIFYICGALIAIGMNAQNILPALQSIFVGAFTPQAVMGGAIGISIKEAVRFGVARGLFSNEAGMGSTPHAHAMAKVEKPQDQGAVAMVGVFIDTFIVLTLTALVILTSGMLGTTGADGQMLTATALAQAAFNNSFGSFGNAFVAICLLFFAFSTIVGWYFFGEQNVKYLFGTRGVTPYRVVVMCFIVMGSLLQVNLVWELADMFNGLMAFPNLIALIGLAKVVSKALDEFEQANLADNK